MDERLLLKHFGGIAPERILIDPPPGKATERDVVELNNRHEGLYELVDGVLVAKVMGLPESIVASTLGRLLGNFVEEHDLGVIAGADGSVRLMPGLVRLPDVAFISWERLGGRGPTEAAPDLAPDLAVEVLSDSNTKLEMERKLKEYFFAGVRLVWYIDPKKQKAEVYTSPDQCVTLSGSDLLEGGAVLPGFRVPLRRLFGRSEPPGGRKRNGRNKPS
jgi:Uma2 family endonuclease